MEKSYDRRTSGFASVLPLLIIIALGVLGLVAYNKVGKSFIASKYVFAESNESGESAEVSGHDGSGSESESSETPEPQETPEPKEFEQENEVEVMDGTEKTKVKIRSGENKFEFEQEGAKFSVKSNFPLTVNPTTRELTVTTPAGSKVVTILPQQAVSNMLASGVITATNSVDLKTESDGKLSYNIDGEKSKKLLGVFEVAVPKKLVVSAETGQVLIVNQSIFSRILDFLSI